jgi:hypothetical protein
MRVKVRARAKVKVKARAKVRDPAMQDRQVSNIDVEVRVS